LVEPKEAEIKDA